MTVRIETGLKRGVPDARGEQAAARARSILGLPVRRCAVRDVYMIDAPLPPARVRAACRAFADPVVAKTAVGRLKPPARFDGLIEIGFKPGVTDNVGRTAEVILEDVLDRRLRDGEHVYTSRQYFIFGRLSRRQIDRFARDVLANELIETIQVFTPEEWRQHEVDLEPPAIRDRIETRVDTVDLGGPDDELMRISREGILSLSLAEMHAVRDYYRRPDVADHRRALGLPAWPTDVELECIAQTWSEHCFHKIFAAEVDYEDGRGGREHIQSLFKTYIQASTKAIARHRNWLVSVFTDNAGIIRFNERLHLAYKVETHNSPSALDPYGGAITGIVGVNRDPMGTGMGCRMLCNVWGYCLGSPFYDGDLPEGLMHPRRIRDGVHGGVIDGGNQSGIPWTRGFEVFDQRYIGKPLVYCGTVGTLPVTVAGGPSERKEVEPGDRLVMCGGRIGKDGIHGATFSSEELRRESPAQAVQIGDAITQRKLYDFLIEARDLGLFRCITDNGAGGISCSFGEMGRLSGGVRADLVRAPLKYEGLQPWEIFLSEAQERMTLAVPPEDIDAFIALAERRDVEATDMGEFTDSGFLDVYYGDRMVASLHMDFLYENGCPRMTIPARWSPPGIPPPAPVRRGRRTQVLEKLISSLDLCSREHKSRMYDGEVKGLSVVKPFVGVQSDMPSDAAVMRVEYESDRGIVLAEGINPWLSDLDTYAMTASVIDEAVRRAVSAGADPERIAGLDNFCWPDPVLSETNPDGPYKMAQLVRSNKALYDVTTAYGVPCISGKDSMKNDSVRGGRKISIPPTLLFSVIGIIDDVRRAVTMDFKQAGDAVYVIGWTRAETGGSAYARLRAAEQGTPGHYGGTAPGLDPETALAVYRAHYRAVCDGLPASSHAPSGGGLAAAFARAAMGGGLGADIDLAQVPVQGEAVDDDARLFAESNSRLVVSCAPNHCAALENTFTGLPCRRVGTVTDERTLRIRNTNGREIIVADLERLRRKFKKTLQDI